MKPEFATSVGLIIIIIIIIIIVILTVYAIDFLSKKLRERIIGNERREPVADDQPQFSEPKAG